MRDAGDSTWSRRAARSRYSAGARRLQGPRTRDPVSSRSLGRTASLGAQWFVLDGSVDKAGTAESLGRSGRRHALALNSASAFTTFASGVGSESGCGSVRKGVPRPGDDRRGGQKTEAEQAATHVLGTRGAGAGPGTPAPRSCWVGDSRGRGGAEGRAGTRFDLTPVLAPGPPAARSHTRASLRA